MKKGLMYGTFIIMTILILINAQSSMEYVKKGLVLCYEIIIPSLFPFFVCSSLLIYSGFAQFLSRVFTPVMLPLFRINGSGSTAFVLGIISGYPLGAITACSLYENRYLSKTETERLLGFCNNSGPLFILGAVGISLYQSPLIGWTLYISHILAAFTVGILFRFYNKNEFIAPEYKLSQPDYKLSEIFSISLQNSVSNILNVCGTVIFFSVAANILISFISVQTWYSSVLIGLVEFTTGTVGISNANLPIAAKLILSSFIVGFAGLSVHFQVMGIIAKHDLSMKPYILGKLMHAVFASLYMFAAMQFIPIKIAVFNHAQPLPNINGSFAVSSLYVCSTVLCVTAISILFGVWLMFVKPKKTEDL